MAEEFGDVKEIPRGLLCDDVAFLNWSESVYCPAFHAPIHGYSIDAIQPRYLVGKIAQFACNKGYMPNGPLSATCSEDGRWSNPPPRCELACDAPTPHPPHGRLTPAKSAYRVKSHVVYECHAGYRLVGARISYCNPDGKWSFPAPECLLDTSSSQSGSHGGGGRARSQNYWRFRRTFTQRGVVFHADALFCL